MYSVLIVMKEDDKVRNRVMRFMYDRGLCVLTRFMPSVDDGYFRRDNESILVRSDSLFVTKFLELLYGVRRNRG